MSYASGPRVAADTVVRASFTGRAGEYFGIWIVNIILTILTLGLYSAWAKVRRQRYFYGNTVILGHVFEYHATGKQILIGRLIVVAALIVLNILATVVPPLAILTPILVIVALPWLIKRGLRFNARVTSYRNVRFDFVGTTGGAFFAIILGGLVAALSLGILAPLTSRWVWRYLLTNLRYGDRPVATEPRLGALYGVWFTSMLLVVFGLVLLGGVFLATATAGGQGSLSLWHWLIVVAILAYAAAGLIYRVGVRNVVLSATTLDGRHEFVSDVPRLGFLWVALTNTIATVVTFGLLRPWAAVRQARLLCDHFAARPAGDLDDIVASLAKSGSAFSAEYLDLEGVDFGF